MTLTGKFTGHGGVETDFAGMCGEAAINNETLGELTKREVVLVFTLTAWTRVPTVLAGAY